MVKSHNCSKNAMFTVRPQGKEVPLCLDCYIRFVNISEYPERPSTQIIQAARIIQKGSGYIGSKNFQVTDSRIGVLNTGTIEDVDSTITALKTIGNAELAQAITQLSEAVIQSSEIVNDVKNQIIELLSAISSEAVAPKEKQRKAVVKAILSELSETLRGVASLASLWESAKAVLGHFFGF